MTSFEKNEFDNVFGPYQYEFPALVSCKNQRIGKSSRKFSQGDMGYDNLENMHLQAMRFHSEPLVQNLECKVKYDRPFANSSLLFDDPPNLIPINPQQAILDPGKTVLNKTGRKSKEFKSSNGLLDSEEVSLSKNDQPYNSKQMQNEHLIERTKLSPLNKRNDTINKPNSMELDFSVTIPRQVQYENNMITSQKTGSNQESPKKQDFISHQQNGSKNSPPKIKEMSQILGLSPIKSANIDSIKSQEEFIFIKSEKANNKIFSDPLVEGRSENLIKPKAQMQERRKAAKAFEEKSKVKNSNFGNKFERLLNDITEDNRNISEELYEETDENVDETNESKSTYDSANLISNKTIQMAPPKQKMEIVPTSEIRTSAQDQDSTSQQQDEPTKSSKKKKKQKKKKNQAEALKEETIELSSQDTSSAPKDIQEESQDTEDDGSELSFSELEQFYNAQQAIIEEEEIEVTQSTRSKYNDKTYNFEELGRRHYILTENSLRCRDFIAKDYFMQESQSLFHVQAEDNDEAIDAVHKRKNKKRKRNKKKKTVSSVTDSDIMEGGTPGSNYAENLLKGPLGDFCKNISNFKK